MGFLSFLFISFIFTNVPVIAQQTYNNISVIDPTGSNGFYMDVYATNNYLYAAQSGVSDAALVIFSLNDPTSPTVVGKGSRFSSEEVRCVAINSDETIAIIGIGSYISIYNISDKAHPNMTSSLYLSGTVYDIIIIGNFVYCATGGRGVVIVNITNIYVPIIYYSGVSSYYSFDLEYDSAQNCLYVANGSYGIFVYAIASDKKLTFLSSIDLDYTARSVAKISNSRIAAGDSYGYVYIIDSSNLNSLSKLGITDVGSEIYGIKYSSSAGNYLFVAEYSKGLHIVSFQIETSPNVFRTMGTTTGGATGYAVEIYKDTYVYLAGGSYGILIYRLIDCIATIPIIPAFSLLSTIITLILMVIPFNLILKHKNLLKT